MNILFETTIHLPFEKVKEGFTKELFIHLSPKVVPFELKRFDGCGEGDEIHINLGTSFAGQKWISVITHEKTDADGWSFIDEGKVLPWPISRWKHHHRVDKVGKKESNIVDDIFFECSPSFFGPLLRPFLWGVFSIRPRRYREFFKES